MIMEYYVDYFDNPHPYINEEQLCRIIYQENKALKRELFRLKMGITEVADLEENGYNSSINEEGLFYLK